MYVGYGAFLSLCFIISGVRGMDRFMLGFDCSENPVPNVTLLNPRGLKIAFEGQHWIKKYTLVMNINEPFKYDPFNYFQSGQIRKSLSKKETIYRRSSITTYWIYKNSRLKLKHGDEIHYYLKVKLLDNKKFTKLYHYVRVENDTDLNKLVIGEDEIYLFNIKEFLLINNFTFQAIENHKLRRARSDEFAHYPQYPGVGRVIALVDKKKFFHDEELHPKTFKEYIQ